MRERDYTIATNVVRIRLMQTLLREMTWERDAGVPEDAGVPVDEAHEVAVILRRWEERCEKVLTPRASRRKAP